jgi:hypothetical protein
MAGLSTRTGSRRPKSAKAGNRGGWGTRRCGERYGDLSTPAEMVIADRRDLSG